VRFLRAPREIGPLEPRFAGWQSERLRKIMRIEVVVDVKTTLGEGPLWDAEQERLYWIDSFDGRVFRSTAAGHEIRCWDVPQKIGSMALRKEATGRSFRSRAVSTLLIS
jgi:sugar lactone lactonase YvrE